MSSMNRLDAIAMQQIEISMTSSMSSLSFGSPPRATEMSKVVGKNGNVKLGSKLAGGESRDLNVGNLLAGASEVYLISKDIRDYIVIPTISMISDIPNTNGDSLSKRELLRFNPKRGCLTYETWKGMPTFVEHDNKDHTKAKGIILDSYLTALRGFKGNLVKNVRLLAFDRTKDPMLCEKLIRRELNTFSLGFTFNAYECSICGHISYGQTFCGHTRPKQRTYRMADGRLCYRRCMNATGFEESVVGDPAYVSNLSDILYDPRKL